jgi:hypothetical protein
LPIDLNDAPWPSLQAWLGDRTSPKTLAARRIGKVEVDHGDTAWKTPDAASYIDKTWAHSESKGFTSPAAHERSRQPMRLRC